MAVSGVVRSWNQDEGWGVIESPEVTGGAAWTHWSMIQMAGYRKLTPGETVRFDWEEPGQDGYPARATAVFPPGQEAPQETEPTEAFSSSTRLDITSPATATGGSALPLPTVTGEGDDVPVIAVPPREPLPALIVWPLTPGTGPAVQKHQIITVQYVGVTWREGQVFDSAWGDDAAFRFEIGAGQVMPGVDEGLAGQNVGSRIVLVIPPDRAYGSQSIGNHIGPNETLVFVIDVLAAEERNGGRSR